MECYLTIQKYMPDAYWDACQILVIIVPDGQGRSLLSRSLPFLATPAVVQVDSWRYLFCIFHRENFTFNKPLIMLIINVRVQ